MSVRRMVVALAVGCITALVLIGAIAITMTFVIQASNNVNTLLLNGKTASAMSAKKTAREVELLLQQQAFDHRQTEAGTKTLAKVEAAVEAHLDATIRTAIQQEAAQALKQVGH